MSFLDTLGKKLNTFGGEVKDSTKDFAEIQQYKRKISQEKELKNQTFQELGYLYYAAHCNDSECEFQEKLTAITNADINIQKYTNEINRVQKEAEQRKTEIREAAAVQPETVPDAAPVQPETVPDAESVQTETAPVADPVQTETAPDTDPVQTETAPVADPVQTETAPDTDPVQTETVPDTDPVQTETVPDAESVSNE